MQEKLVASVCHGPGALTEAELNGKPFVKGKKVVPQFCSCLLSICHLLKHSWQTARMRHVSVIRWMQHAPVRTQLMRVRMRNRPIRDLLIPRNHVRAGDRLLKQ